MDTNCADTTTHEPSQHDSTRSVEMDDSPQGKNTAEEWKPPSRRLFASDPHPLNQEEIRRFRSHRPSETGAYHRLNLISWAKRHSTTSSYRVFGSSLKDKGSRQDSGFSSGDSNLEDQGETAGSRRRRQEVDEIFNNWTESQAGGGRGGGKISVDNGAEVVAMMAGRPSEVNVVESKTSNEHDEGDWQYSFLKSRLRAFEMEDLFSEYIYRLQHAMLINCLGLLLCFSLAAITALVVINVSPSHSEIRRSIGGIETLSSEPASVESLPEIIGNMVIFGASFILLVCFYNETLFLSRPGWHSVIGAVMVIYVVGVDVALTLYHLFAHDNDVPLLYGHVQLSLVLVYMYVPFSSSTHRLVAGLLSSIAYVGLLAAVLYANAVSGAAEKLVLTVVFVLWTNIFGLYSRRLSNIVFMRAFLDKRRSLQTKFMLENEKVQEEFLLSSILPSSIMQEVKQDFKKEMENVNYKSKALRSSSNLYVSRHENVSILYADICNFTPLTTQLKVHDLVMLLYELFGQFDLAAEAHNCLRIKILGDCYYCVSGVPEFTEHHAENCVLMGFEMIRIIAEVREKHKVDVDMRIGIHSGTVLSGVLGGKKWQYDVWSNDVTIANHLEQTGRAGHVHITRQTKEVLPTEKYEFIPHDARDNDSLLNREDIDTFFVKIKNGQPTVRQSVSWSHTLTDQLQVVSEPQETSPECYYVGDAPEAKEIEYIKDAKSAVPYRTRSTLPVSAGTFKGIVNDAKEKMAKEVSEMPLSKKSQWLDWQDINPVFLSFRKLSLCFSFIRQPDPLFKFYMLCALGVAVTIVVTQQMYFPGPSISLLSSVVVLLLLSLLLPLCWVAWIYMKIKDQDDLYFTDEDTGCLLRAFINADKFVMMSVFARIAAFLLISIGLCFAALSNLAQCDDARDDDRFNLTTLSPLDNLTTASYTDSSATPSPAPCSSACDPWFFTDSLSLCLLAVWGFFRMHYLLKFASYLGAVGLYAYYILGVPQDLYDQDVSEMSPPPYLVSSESLSPALAHLLFVLSLAVALHVMDRQMEYIMRLDYSWKDQMEKEQKEAEETHMANKILLNNILPKHVAERFLEPEYRNEVYHESYNHVAVLFASIPNYSDFCREREVNDNFQNCLMVLNEIILDFDLLTFKYQSIEKIKVVGSTYMAACGLQPGKRSGDDAEFVEQDPRENVKTLATFASAMFHKLEKINQESMQNFRLRVGIDMGPVIAGVVGFKKPHYDIWGNTVNVASRMDYTGEVDKIHVTKTVARILKDEDQWKVTSRGTIEVKGKGPMDTFFVDPLTPKEILSAKDAAMNPTRKFSYDEYESSTNSSRLRLTAFKKVVESKRMKYFSPSNMSVKNGSDNEMDEEALRDTKRRMKLSQIHLGNQKETNSNDIHTDTSTLTAGCSSSVDSFSRRNACEPTELRKPHIEERFVDTIYEQKRCETISECSIKSSAESTETATQTRHRNSLSSFSSNIRRSSRSEPVLIHVDGKCSAEETCPQVCVEIEEPNEEFKKYSGLSCEYVPSIHASPNSSDVMEETVL